MKNRIVSILLAVLMAVSVTACSSEDSEKSSKKESAEEESEEYWDGENVWKDADEEDTAEKPDEKAPEETAELPDDLLDRLKTERKEKPSGGTSVTLPEGPAVWKDAYLEYLDDLEKEVNSDYDNVASWQYGFIYVNEDDIPEMVVSTGYEAGGNQLLTCIDGTVYSWQTARLGFCYADHANLLDNNDGHSGYYYDFFVKIGPDGWEDVAGGEWTDAVYAEGEAEPGEDYAYRWEDQHVSEKEYYDAIDALWDGQIPRYWQHGVDLDSMRAYLSGKVSGNALEAYQDILESGRIPEEYTEFALVSCASGEPCMVARSSDQMCVIYWENGLLEIGPSWYMNDYVLRILPEDGTVWSVYRSPEGDVSDTLYRIQNGSLFSEDYSKRADRDQEWNIVTDASGKPVFRYYHGGREITQAEYEAIADERYDQEAYAITDLAIGEDSPLLDYRSRGDLIAEIAAGEFD